jgi:hypothetical protein
MHQAAKKKREAVLPANLLEWPHRPPFLVVNLQDLASKK